MLNRIIAWSLRHRGSVIALAVLVSVLGTFLANRLPIDVLPDLNRPTVTILTEAHGLVPEDVEQLVTRYIEQAVTGATGVVRVRSTSGLGLSVVFVEFDWDQDIYRSRQIVQEKLQLAQGNLPPGIVPTMAPISSVMGQIQIIGLRSRSGETDPTELRALADQSIRLRLLAVPGVAQVVSIGGAPRQLQVLVDADRLRGHDVTLAEVAAAVASANLNASGGFLNIGARGPLVTATGLVRGVEDLEVATVRPDPVRPVLLGDVARVEFGPAAIRTGDAGVQGAPGVVLVVFKQPDVDTIQLTQRVDEELAQLSRTLPPDLEILGDIYRQSDFIERAVHNVAEAVWIGGLLVVLVLFLFLLNVRTTAITLTAIPLSIALTAMFFQLVGISINTMTLGGLAVAIGALVDDAIVDVENVFRRLRENVAAGRPRPALAVVFRASSEVRKPILIGTIVVAVVYMPLFALSGMEGRLFTPIGIAYIVSILASLLVSLTVTPVLCAWLLPRAKAMARGDGPLVRGLKGAAGAMIRTSLRFPHGMAIGLGAAVVVSLVALSRQGTEFLPPFNEGVIQVNLILPPGTSLETSDAYGARLERLLLDVEGVAHLGRRTGRAEGDEHAEGVHFTEVIVSFDPDSPRTREQVIADIRHRVGQAFPGVATSVEQPMAHLLSHMLSGVNAQVAIKVFGPDLAVLRRAAKDVQQAVQGVPGVADLMVEPQVLVERIEVVPRRRDLARLGLTPRDVTETVELALEGDEITRLVQGQYSYPIVVRLEAKDRRDLHAVEGLLLHAPTGERLRIADVADVRLAPTPNNVNHENASRRIVVSHNVEGRSLGEVVADVRRALDPVVASLPPGYAVHVGGQFEAQEDAALVVFLLSLVSLAVMYLVLHAHFRSANLAIQVLLNVPAAMIGATVLLLATHQTLSIATLVGFVALGGIATRNGILLMDHYLHLMREEGEGFTKAMIERAGRERVVPVLMTALTSGIALVPLVLSPGQPGRELLYPVATVIVGGLVSTTLLDLLLSPGRFWLFGRRAAERLAQMRLGEDIEGELMAFALEEEGSAENPTPRDPSDEGAPR